MKIVIYFMMLAIFSAFIGCKGDEPSWEPQLSSIPTLKEDSVYTFHRGSQKFIISNISGSNATMKIMPGVLDLDSIDNNDVAGRIPAPCIILGAKEASFPVTISYDTIDYYKPGKYGKFKYTIRGSYENETASYQITANIYETYSTLESTPKLKSPANIGEGYTLKVNGTAGESAPDFTSQPFFINWQVAGMPEIESLSVSPSDVLRAILYTPMLQYPKYEIGEFDGSLAGFFRAIALLITNNEYASISICHSYYNESSNTVAKCSSFPSGTFSFLPSGNNNFTMYVFPSRIFDIMIYYARYKGDPEFYHYPSDSPELYELLSYFLLGIAPHNAEGISMHYDVEGPRTRWTFNDSNTAVQLLRNVIMSYLSDSDHKRRLIKNLGKSVFSPQAAEIEQAIEYLSKMFDNTISLEFGVSLDTSDEYCPYSYNDYTGNLITSNYN